jgi:cell division protein FtsB
MSLLKQILSPFVEFEDDKKKEQVKENIPPVVPDYKAPIPPVVPDYRAPIEENVEHPLITSANVKATSQTQTTAPHSVVSTPLPEHVQYFEKLIDEANAKNPFFQGTDYKEFIDSKFDIDNIADEATRYKTAFNVLKRTGLTKEKLLSTAHEYHNIIGRDLNAFQSAHSQQYQKEVKQREQLIQKKAEELQGLSQKINALKKEISQLSQEITETKDKLNLTKNSFLLAGEHKQNEIQTELQKIEQYF